MRPLILGDGLLGSELIKQTGWNYISRKKDNIDFVIDFDQYLDKIYSTRCDVLVNCIANTDTYSKDREKHWKINYEYTSHLIDFCANEAIKLVHISTDYVYSNSSPFASEDDVPVHCNNWYGYTKLLSDAYVQLIMKDYLLIRTSFKPRPFPYKTVVSQIGNFDYVDVIATMIVDLINNNASGIYNVGSETKTLYSLSRQTRNDTLWDLDKKVDESFPLNITMNISKMKMINNIKG